MPSSRTRNASLRVSGDVRKNASVPVESAPRVGLVSFVAENAWLGVLIAYVAAIVVGSTYHEPWRDEVVAMSVARDSPTLADLWTSLRFEGHPILWYLCLRVACAALGSTLALPALSILFASASAWLLLRYCPLPLWFLALWLASYYPLFQYAVVWRSYGLSMLLLFTFCALYTQRRSGPVAMGVVLALLANTTWFGLVLALAAGAMVVVDGVVAGFSARRGPLLAGAAILVAGVAHTLVEVLPDPKHFHHAHIFAQSTTTWVDGLRDAIIFPLAHSGAAFNVPYASAWAWLWLATLLAARRFALCVFVALSLWGFEAIFTLAWAPSAWHLGNVMLVVVAALWLGWPWASDAVGGRTTAIERRALAMERFATWGRRLVSVPLLVALGYQVAVGVRSLVDDVRFDYSSSRRLAAVLDADPTLQRAIVIGEPEIMALTLPYYRDNPLFLPQENVFRRWIGASASGTRRSDLDLDELLATARSLRDRYGVPVVIALWWRLDGPPQQTAFQGMFFQQTFTMTPAAHDAFLTGTQLLGRFRDARFSNENYDVFVVR